MRLTALASAALVALAAGPAAAQETIDNGEFTSWSKFKPGTSITTRMTTSTAGMTNEVTTTITLVEVGTDKVVLETSGVTKAMGMEFKLPAAKRDVSKTIPLPKGVKKPAAPGTKPEAAYEEGMETLKVGGTEVKAKWYKVKSETGGLKSDAKVWTSDDVPGTMVKMEATTTGLATGETKLEVLEFKKP
jgi:hypothetical protein